jgi:hypothetical protein
MNNELHTQLLHFGKKKEPKGHINTLDKFDVQTVIATMEFFGATPIWIQQTFFDLRTAKYPVYDWLAMCVNGRNDDNRSQNEMALKVLIHSFIKSDYDEEKFIDDLRQTDYEIDNAWESIKIEQD